ncbi:uncharacterized protein TRUGW13939_05298 [Talaromyces rugulosus]|uniref:Fungal N-terminal domain-containing protein n=1 Tax=Talaromyces rugulosus TaxID=121627 RepID=A0A7H8QW29_TALRU|nr:uncharacterized protein TRUGW13939_05298 [Talaromyces rugulosus]QKX58177.1 hypothetical protein TRUGW13939_05298 [Talaromyces rugulosus]
MSFGFSAGDFIAGANLACTIVRALSESRGASTEYQDVIRELGCIQQTFLQVEQMRASNLFSQATMNAITCIINSSIEVMAGFLERTDKYRQSLSVSAASYQNQNNISHGVLKFQESGSNTQTGQFVSGPSVSETSSIATVASHQSSTYESTAKDEAIARLEMLISDERAQRRARDAAREAAMVKAAADKLAAKERAAADKKLVEEAIARERQKWEKETSHKPLRERMSYAYKRVTGRNYDT